MTYRVPLMSEIHAQPRNGLKVVSTFSGGGGSCTGYVMAGYEVIWMNEFIEEARRTYAANHPSTIIDARDIRQVQAADILSATGLQVGELDLFDGSPPCSAFSTAGKGAKGWGKEKAYSDNAKQVVEDLFFEYIRLVRDLQPKVFVAENVSGLVKGASIGYFKQIMKDLKACGYQVEAQLLNASRLGVPQARERIIIVGVRDDLNLKPVFPKPQNQVVTLREALAGVSDSEGAYKLTGKIETLWRNTPQGGKFDQAYQKLYGKGNMFLHLRLPWDKPAPTMKQSALDLYHPDEPRSLSIAEAKRICSFPDDYVLTGTAKQQWERMGRAVPPLMMKAVAQALKEGVFDVL